MNAALRVGRATELMHRNAHYFSARSTGTEMPRNAMKRSPLRSLRVILERRTRPLDQLIHTRKMQLFGTFWKRDRLVREIRRKGEFKHHVRTTKRRILVKRNQIRYDDGGRGKDGRTAVPKAGGERKKEM